MNYQANIKEDFNQLSDKFDDMVEAIDLEMQSAISKSNLGVSHKDAFDPLFTMYEGLVSFSASSSDPDIRWLLLERTYAKLTELEKKVEQLS